MDGSTSGFLSSTISWSLLKLMPIESVMLSNHPILCLSILLLLENHTTRKTIALTILTFISKVMSLLFIYLFTFCIQNLFIGMVSHSSWYRVISVLLPSERASFCKPCFSSYRLAEDRRAANTQNYCLCMAKDGGDFIASWEFYIHAIGIGALHQVLLLMFPLLFWRGMKKILCERHVLMRRSSPLERAV